MIKKIWFTALCLGICFGMQAQDDEKVTNEDGISLSDKKSSNELDPLRPAKAAFFSAVLPGLGQAYNKKYWKIPIVYAAIGGGLYFYFDNNNVYKRYRNAYKRRLAGFT